MLKKLKDQQTVDQSLEGVAYQQPTNKNIKVTPIARDATSGQAIAPRGPRGKLRGPQGKVKKNKPTSRRLVETVARHGERSEAIKVTIAPTETSG